METLNKLGEIQFTSELWLFMIPGILMLIDFITGLLNAWKRGEIKSSKMREGLIKKCGETLILIIGEMFTIALSISSAIITAISWYIIIMELISICENFDKMGVPLPGFIKKALKTSMDKIQNDGKEDKNNDDRSVK